MIFIIFGVMPFCPCWKLLPHWSEWDTFIKSKTPSVRHGFGSTYNADVSRHPEPKKPAGVNIAEFIQTVRWYKVMLAGVCSVVMAVSCRKSRQFVSINYLGFISVFQILNCSQQMKMFDCSLQKWRNVDALRRPHNMTQIIAGSNPAFCTWILLLSVSFRIQILPKYSSWVLLV